MAKRRNLPPPGATAKWCPSCEAEVAVDDWYWHASGSRGSCRLCARRWHRKRYGSVERTGSCERCGTTYVTTRDDTRYCSRECKDLARQAKAAADRLAEKRGLSRVCVGCHRPIPDTRRADAAYCSDECHANVRGTTRMASRRIRVRGSEGNVVHVRRVDVYERDGWVCQLCGEPVDREAKFPDPWAPSLDHVVPLARGGDHEITNLQTAHLRCNVTRRDAPLMDPAPALVMEGRAYLTVPEAAERLGVTRGQLDRWIRRGHIPIHRFGGRYRYLLVDEVVALVTADRRAWSGRSREGIRAHLPDDGRDYLTLPEVAARLGVPEGRVYSWARHGDPALPVHRFGPHRRQYVDAADVDALAARGTAALDGRNRRWKRREAEEGPSDAS